MSFAIIIKVFNRLGEWFCYTVVLSLLPLILSLLLRYIIDIEIYNTHFFSELFLFCSMFAVSVLKDIFDIKGEVHSVLQFTMILIIILCSVLYGGLFVIEYLDKNIESSVMLLFRTFLRVCISMELIVGLLIQIYGAVKDE